jgi:hypothetical protein
MPMPNDSGRDVRLLRNPTTGTFDSFDWDASGNPTFDDSDEHVVLSSINEEAYWANPRRASKLMRVTLDRTGTDAQLRSAAEGALKYALDQGLIRSADVAVVKRGPGSYSVRIGYRSRSGHQRNVRLPIGS